MSETKTMLPGNVLTVIIRDIGPLIHLQEPPTHRSVQITLTDEQRTALALQWTGSNCGVDHYEEIGQCFIEPGARP
jgi:hypothetical protein